MIEHATETLRDPELAWVAIQEATLEHRYADLAEIAICLYGQLGEARAEAGRLRASLQSALCSLSVIAAAG